MTRLPHPAHDDRPSSGSWALDTAVLDLAEQVTRLEARLGDYGWEEADLEGLLHLLADVREQRTALAQTEAVIESWCARRTRGMGERVEFPGLLAERRGGTKRTAWDHDRMSGRVQQYAVEQFALDSDGVIDPVSAEVARAAVATVLALARPSWRVTALRDAGVRYDDACTSEPGRTSVQISRGTHAS